MADIFDVSVTYSVSQEQPNGRSVITFVVSDLSGNSLYSNIMMMDTLAFQNMMDDDVKLAVLARYNAWLVSK